METIRLKENSDSLVKVELNDDGDFLMLTATSATFFDNYINFLENISNVIEDSDKRIEEFKAQYSDGLSDGEKIEIARKVAREEIAFSEKAIDIVNSFLGENTVQKYFKTLYDNVPDFVPGEECFAEFITNITPAIEKIYGKKIEIRANISKKKTEKYVPQDFRKKGTKC